MEDSNLENEESENLDIVQDTIEELALSVSDDYITDDNPSIINGLTSLEQIILFELEDYIDEKITLDYIKTKVLLLATEYNFDEEEELSDEDFDQILLDPFMTPVYSTVDFNSPYLQEDIDKIAEYLFEGKITEDNISPKNFYNSLEQLISYILKDEVYNKEDYTKIMTLIKSRHIALRMGSNNGKEDFIYKGYMTIHFSDIDL